jgi:hypothetical protein
MLRKSVLIRILIGVLLALPAAAVGQDFEDYVVDEGAESGEPTRTVPARALDRFSFESETVDGLWAETGAFYTNTESDRDGVKADFDGPSAFARVSYGQKKWEAGLFFPYYNDFQGRIDDASGRSDVDATGIGDLQAYGKFIPLQSDIIDAGAGFLISFPTGDDDDGLGTGEFGFLPHFTAQLDLQAAQIRGHIGWEWFTANNDDRAADRLVYGFGIFIPLFHYVTFRNEFVGTELDIKNDPKMASYLGGLDIRVPIGNFDLLLRPTGIAGISERAPDWGIGGSIAVSSATYK